MSSIQHTPRALTGCLALHWVPGEEVGKDAKPGSALRKGGFLEERRLLYNFEWGLRIWERTQGQSVSEPLK